MNISDTDKDILVESVKRLDVNYFEKNFSRISKCGKYKYIDDYKYYETDEYVFYDIFKKCFFDKHKNIIFLSNFIFQNVFYIQKHISDLLIYIENIRIYKIISLMEINR